MKSTLWHVALNRFDCALWTSAYRGISCLFLLVVPAWILRLVVIIALRWSIGLGNIRPIMDIDWIVVLFIRIGDDNVLKC